MARKSVLTKEQIVRTAYDICRDKGIGHMTIRMIASQLKTSTAPIYTQYKNREAILNDLDKYIKNKLLMSMRTPRTLSGFLNIGLGIIDFTLENKLIVNEFYYNLKRLNFDIRDEMDGFVKEMQKDPFLSLLTYDTLYGLLDDMRVYTFGIVGLICSETDRHKSIEDYQLMLESLGDKLITHHIISAGKAHEAEKLMDKKKTICVKE